ncbi:MAG: hypothetical protein JST65_09170, partial [Acidobacteria bacterium]|nr:hypothetical protein [Acidobacteriota bacterium]
MSAAQQRNWLLAATLAVTAILVLVRTPSRRVGANDPPVIRKVKAKADASPQPVVLEGRVAPAVTVAIPVPAERMRLVAKMNELVAAGAVVGTTPG